MLLHESSLLSKTAGLLLIAITGLVILREWSGFAGFDDYTSLLAVALILVLVMGIRNGGRVFIAIGIGLVAASIVWHETPSDLLGEGMSRAAFIAAFFTALATLRHSAERSPAIRTAGEYLAGQPPGKRYLALTVGGHLYALVLNYGSIALLGSLATAAANSEPNLEIREHRRRRMLLAIQRGFLSTLPWSPLTFAVAITLSLVEDASWSEIVLPCFMSGMILLGTGWALDTIFKPKLKVKAQALPPPPGGPRSLIPLFLLLASLISLIAILYWLTNIRAVAIVLALVPAVALAWTAFQAKKGDGLGSALRESKAYVFEDLPSYRNEIVLLMMAGFIGTVGSGLLQPLLATSQIDLTALPDWLILISLVWLIPLAGQIGMNPILSVSLFLPLLPSPDAMGYSAGNLVVAVTAGWALSGASSPFTATTMLIGSFGQLSALRVGVRWNGTYSLVCGLLLSLWVAIIIAT